MAGNGNESPCLCPPDPSTAPAFRSPSSASAAWACPRSTATRTDRSSIAISAQGDSRGLISGCFTRDPRAGVPRCQDENLRHNLDLVEELRKIAEKKEKSVAQIAIAWCSRAARASCRSSASTAPTASRRPSARKRRTWAPTTRTRSRGPSPASAAAGGRYPPRGTANLHSKR